MGNITPYESAKGRRYRVRYRKPDRTEAEKRGFTTMREAKDCAPGGTRTPNPLLRTELLFH